MTSIAATTSTTTTTSPARALSPTAGRPAPWWLRELATGRAAYEELLGWPVSVQVGNRALTLAMSATVSAVSMPATLGAVVREQLGLALQRAAVVSDPDGLRWTFLTKPPDDLRPGVATELAAADVAIGSRGDHVVVPVSPTGQPARTPLGRPVPRSWRWVEPPAAGRPLSPAYPVIAVVRRLTEHRPFALGA